jgi:hypothetical protein
MHVAQPPPDTAVPGSDVTDGRQPQAGDEEERLAALTFDVLLVAGRPCLVTEGPYDVGRIRLF